ncbi:MAG: hypothetical protein LQ340_005844 [Diploschistes diacapsis]|nr:MAG: hypothetical protein LQ340_005844 [Diploschistes diacapsis]
MPADDSPALIVARYLKSNNYEATLDAFLLEANLPPDAGSIPSKNALTLEKILQEKKLYDLSLFRMDFPRALCTHPPGPPAAFKHPACLCRGAHYGYRTVKALCACDDCGSEAAYFGCNE